MLTEYTYVFAIGTFFALLEAYNNGASMLLRSAVRSLATSTDQHSQTMSPTPGPPVFPPAPSLTSKLWSSV
jgi:hypothetical protein